MFPDKPAQKIDIQLCQNKLEGKKYIFWDEKNDAKSNKFIFFLKKIRNNLNALYSTDNNR